MRLEGFKCLVTGGSRGIGREIVKGLAKEGAQVAFTYSSHEGPCQELLKELSGKHFFLKMDISDETSINEGFETVLKNFGQLDGLVNNAGITQDQLLLRMKSEDFDRVIQTNLRGSFLCTRSASKVMLKARKGSLVHITSVIGQTGNPGQVNYSASKAGIEAMSKSVALELASRNIRSNCIAPGFIETEMTQALSEEQRKKILEQVPLGTIGHAEDVAKAVVFLLSEDSKYITGHTLNVNGGLYCG